jgi:hypothetical protein
MDATGTFGQDPGCRPMGGVPQGIYRMEATGTFRQDPGCRPSSGVP